MPEPIVVGFGVQGFRMVWGLKSLGSARAAQIPLWEEVAGSILLYISVLMPISGLLETFRACLAQELPPRKGVIQVSVA